MKGMALFKELIVCMEKKKPKMLSRSENLVPEAFSWNTEDEKTGKHDHGVFFASISEVLTGVLHYSSINMAERLFPSQSFIYKIKSYRERFPCSTPLSFNHGVAHYNTTQAPGSGPL